MCFVFTKAVMFSHYSSPSSSGKPFSSQTILLVLISVDEEKFLPSSLQMMICFSILRNTCYPNILKNGVPLATALNQVLMLIPAAASCNTYHTLLCTATGTSSIRYQVYLRIVLIISAMIGPLFNAMKHSIFL